jgi:hypothetical protein
MATFIVPVITPLNAGHPLTAVIAKTKQVNVSDPAFATTGNGLAGLKCTVRQADVSSFASTLAGILNTTSNYGPAGT